MRKTTLVLAVIALAAARPGASQTPAPPPHHERAPEDPFRLQPLSGGVYALYGRGGNVAFFVGPEAVVVVDSQFKDLAPGIVEKIKAVTDKPIEYLLNTHHHGDHVGGNEVFRQFAVIVAHDNVRKRMLASPQTILRDYPQRLEDARKAGNQDSVKFLSEQIEWAKKVKIEEIAAPVLTFDSEIRIHVGGETIHVWHTSPAHTDGDGVVFFEKANVVHMGDLFFHKVIPFIDIGGGGSVKGYLEAHARVSARVPPDVTIVPGHGEVTDLTGMEGLRQYILDILEAAKKARAAGKSKEEFLKEVDLPAYKDFRGYNTRFKDNCAAAYDEVG